MLHPYVPLISRMTGAVFCRWLYCSANRSPSSNVKPGEFAPSAMTSPFTPTIESILLEDLLHIEEIIISDDEVVVDKHDHIRRINQTRYPSISLARGAGAAKNHSHVTNGVTDLRNIGLIDGRDDDVIRASSAVTLAFISTCCRISGRPCEAITSPSFISVCHLSCIAGRVQNESCGGLLGPGIWTPVRRGDGTLSRSRQAHVRRHAACLGGTIDGTAHRDGTPRYRRSRRTQPPSIVQNPAQAEVNTRHRQSW